VDAPPHRPIPTYFPSLRLLRFTGWTGCLGAYLRFVTFVSCLVLPSSILYGGRCGSVALQLRFIFSLLFSRVGSLRTLFLGSGFTHWFIAGRLLHERFNVWFWRRTSRFALHCPTAELHHLPTLVDRAALLAPCFSLNLPSAWLGGFIFYHTLLRYTEHV
jgi:hypothetical protein